MKLNHIALSVEYPEDVFDFYVKILNMKFVRSFTIEKNLAKNIFNKEEEISVNIVQSKDIAFELFLTKSNIKSAYNHICISIKNRDEIFNNAVQNGYEYVKIERNNHAMLFIKDKSDNIFELKE